MARRGKHFNHLTQEKKNQLIIDNLKNWLITYHIDTDNNVISHNVNLSEAKRFITIEKHLYKFYNQ